MPIVPALTREARALARHIVGNVPQARIAVLYQNDDFGHDMLKGFRQGLGADAGRMIVAEASYEVTDPTIDSQVVSLKAAGADTLMLFAVPRFSAQALRKTAAIAWKPLRFVAAPSANATSVIKPVGPEIATGVMAVRFLKDPPGIKLNTSQTRHTPIDQFQVSRFDGRRWVAAGGVVGD